jgi:hypothetical protein
MKGDRVMAKVNSSPSTSKKMRPALSEEARINQLISLSYDLVEERLRNGTATSQETTHFLKMGSPKARLEKEILELNKELVKAKTDEIVSRKENEKGYKDAINAFRKYSGQTTREEEEEEDYDDY